MYMYMYTHVHPLTDSHSLSPAKTAANDRAHQQEERHYPYHTCHYDDHQQPKGKPLLLILLLGNEHNTVTPSYHRPIDGPLGHTGVRDILSDSHSESRTIALECLSLLDLARRVVSGHLTGQFDSSPLLNLAAVVRVTCDIVVDADL